MKKYPRTSIRTSEEFRNWCNSYQRRLGWFPNLPDALSRFHNIYNTNKTFCAIDSCREEYY